MRHRVRTRPARADHPPSPLTTDREVVARFLSDAAHVPGGYAPAAAFPNDETDVAAIVKSTRGVLAVGAQSSLTGGATPRGEVVVCTHKLAGINRRSSSAVTVGAGVPLSDLQLRLAPDGLFYPPVPTFTGAFVGGTIGTNAAGPATFKYGSTRDWVSAITVVLASGEVLELERGQVVAGDESAFEIENSRGHVARVPVPTYTMPHVAKLSAGYFARPGMDLIDLFIGSEGTLGIIVSATLRLVPLPRQWVALIRCPDERIALSLTRMLRNEGDAAWQNRGPLDIAAIEFMDARSIALLQDDAFARAGVPRPGNQSVLLLVQVETTDDEAPALARLGEVLSACGVTDDPVVASADDEQSRNRLFQLREAVPATVNAAIAAAQARMDGGIQKTAADMVVPFDRLSDSLRLYRDAFHARGLDVAIWGHVSDGNLHPNVLPRSLDDVRRGQQAIVEIARGVIAMGGAPLAEHGVGRSALKQRLLVEMYGEGGIEEMRAVKRALDPAWTLAPGVLFPA